MVLSAVSSEVTGEIIPLFFHYTSIIYLALLYVGLKIEIN